MIMYDYTVTDVFANGHEYTDTYRTEREAREYFNCFRNLYQCKEMNSKGVKCTVLDHRGLVLHEYRG